MWKSANFTDCTAPFLGCYQQQFPIQLLVRDCGHIANLTSYFTCAVLWVREITSKSILHRKNNLLLCDESYVSEMNWKPRDENKNRFLLQPFFFPLHLKCFIAFHHHISDVNQWKHISFECERLKIQLNFDESNFFLLFILNSISMRFTSVNIDRCIQSEMGKIIRFNFYFFDFD
jgi:hypothetical protein